MTSSKIEIRPFKLTTRLPNGKEKVTILRVPMEWDEEIKEWLMTPEATQEVENTQAVQLGLPLPSQLKELRQQLGYSQTDMGRLLRVGAKTWTRWESGRHRPTPSSSLIIQALIDGKIPVEYLRMRAGMKLQRSKPIIAKPNTTLFECLTSARSRDDAKIIAFADFRVTTHKPSASVYLEYSVPDFRVTTHKLSAAVQLDEYSVPA